MRALRTDPRVAEMSRNPKLSVSASKYPTPSAWCGTKTTKSPLAPLAVTAPENLEAFIASRISESYLIYERGGCVSRLAPRETIHAKA
tara:strand:+ start:948 stop:1211 length:264 start_codon:yes stop_codon:yes gene_type:complete